MKRQKEPPGEEYRIRCPRLGHQIHFAYCRAENQGLPCFKVLDCWYDHFLVEEFLRTELTPEQWEGVLGKPPRPKLLSLVELAQQARKRQQEDR